MKKYYLFVLSAVTALSSQSQKLSLSGTLGITYEHYGLDLTPDNPNPQFYRARRPWNVVRFNFNPIVKLGKWVIPANFNFSPMQTNFTLPRVPGHQSFWQYLTNPMNSFGLSPKLGSTEMLLGTQYIMYSDLSTGDLGIFGAGVNLAPGKFRIKVFAGASQRPVNYLAPSANYLAGVAGAYQRNHIMAQLGLEKEGRYFVGFNFVKSKDNKHSATLPTASSILPQENMIVSFLAKTSTAKGWNCRVELGQSFLTRNLQLTTAVAPPYKDFKPFINQNTSSFRDTAAIAGITKQGKDWELGGKISYYGAGYYTAGYSYMGNDRLEYTLNTRFNAWTKKMNVVAALGQRFGNWNHTVSGSRTSQIIANVNVFTQVTDHFSMNISYNNFGFNAPSATGYKSVSNELSANPTYTWSNSSMSHLISGTYTLSKYDETITGGPPSTHNNTQTALLLYVPSFFTKNISPDFSVMWFKNSSTPIVVNLNLWSFTAGLGWKINKKLNLKSQLQYNISTTSPFTADKNLLGTLGADWKMTKKLSWQFSMTGNLFRSGNAITLIGYTGTPGYLESTIRTGLQYRF